MRTLLAIAALVAIAGPLVAEARESGINMSSDGRLVLVQKDVGSDRWAIDLDTQDFRVTGNIFSGSQPPAFVDCSITNIERNGSTNLADWMLTYNCSVAASCAGSDCPGWMRTGAPIELSGSFFAPDSGGDPQPTPIPTSTPLPNPTSTPVVEGGLSGMIGTWDFTFTIISAFTDTYRMRQIITVNGHQVIDTLNQYGNQEIVARVHDLVPDSPLPYEFTTIDNQEGVVCDFHLWNQNGNTVSGLTFILETSSSQCDTSTLHGSGYVMTGVRTSSSAEAAGLESLGVPLTDVVEARVKALVLDEALEPGASEPGNDFEDVRAALQKLTGAAP